MTMRESLMESYEYVDVRENGAGIVNNPHNTYTCASPVISISKLRF